jgi:molecular chaperone GrpE (heat shock protein)
MNKKQRPLERPNTAELIGEMMLAKTVLEEKNELIDRKDDLIQEYRARENELRRELEMVRSELERCRDERANLREAARHEGARGVVEEVVRVAADYDGCEDSAAADLTRRLITLFQHDYGLEILAAVPARIDPAIHRVVEVGFQREEKQSIQILARGYRLDQRVLRPMLLRVLRNPFGGSDAQDKPHLGRPDGEA